MEQAGLFTAAAAALEGGTARRALPLPVRRLLDALGPAPAGSAADAALLRVGARCGPPFRLPSPEAPGLVALGAEVDLAAAAGEAPGRLPPGSASGTGTTPGAALRACLGEAAELLASVETAADRARMRAAPPRGAAPDAALDALVAALPWPGGRVRTRWLPARRLGDGAELWLPREVALRGTAARRAFPPPWPLSLGCGAGPTPEQAALHGLLELIERDAVARWWRGATPARAVALEEPAAGRAAALLATLRQDRAGARRSWLLDITAAAGVPVAAAVSFAPDGGGFCCGFAARAGGLAPAAEAALLEMAQMELAHALVLAKARTRGEAAHSPRDLAHRRRYEGVRAERCAQVHPARPPAPPDPGLPPPGAPAGEVLAALVQRLTVLGLAPIRLDLARPGGALEGIGLPVVRMLCPGLETAAAAAPAAWPQAGKTVCTGAGQAEPIALF
jgi:ribosomal protein S12 methylthiotransferase accessory factor